jgi:hypothetical protein
MYKARLQRIEKMMPEQQVQIKIDRIAADLTHAQRAQRTKRSLKKLAAGDSLIVISNDQDRRGNYYKLASGRTVKG